MTRVNLKPITNTNRPTSHVRVGRSKIGGNTGVVRISHSDREAFFRAESADDRVMSDIGSKAYIHDNVADLFGGISYDKPFFIDASADIASVPSCDKAEIYIHGADPAPLEEHLRSSEYLLHRIEEITEVGGSSVRFTVGEMSPSTYSTLRVTEETDLEFVDEPVDPSPGMSARTGHRSGSSSPAGDRPSEGGEEGTTVSIDPTVPQVSFEEDVAGLSEVKETARMLLALFDTEIRQKIVGKYGEEFADRGGSMLLYGPPGCGKTHVSEAIAYEAKENTDIEDQYGKVTFLEVRGSDIQSKYAGESEKNVSAVFEQAHSIAQEDGFAVLFFDEIETLIPDRSDDNLQRHERAVTNAFLQEMNDVEDNLFVIGATNMPFTIDPAATRRFPVQQFIEQPGAEVMAEVWEKKLDSLPNAGRIEFDRLGAETVGYTPAEVADRILGTDFQRELVRSVIDGEPRDITTEYLLEQIEETEPKTVRQFVTSVRGQVDELEGYPRMKKYVTREAERFGIRMNTGGESLTDLLTDESVADGDDPGDTI